MNTQHRNVYLGSQKTTETKHIEIDPCQLHWTLYGSCSRLSLYSPMFSNKLTINNSWQCHKKKNYLLINSKMKTSETCTHRKSDESDGWISPIRNASNWDMVGGGSFFKMKIWSTKMNFDCRAASGMRLFECKILEYLWRFSWVNAIMQRKKLLLRP